MSEPGASVSWHSSPRSFSPATARAEQAAEVALQPDPQLEADAAAAALRHRRRRRARARRARRPRRRRATTSRTCRAGGRTRASARAPRRALDARLVAHLEAGAREAEARHARDDRRLGERVRAGHLGRVCARARTPTRAAWSSRARTRSGRSSRRPHASASARSGRRRLALLQSVAAARHARRDGRGGRAAGRRSSARCASARRSRRPGCVPPGRRSGAGGGATSRSPRLARGRRRRALAADAWRCPTSCSARSTASPRPRATSTRALGRIHGGARGGEAALGEAHARRDEQRSGANRGKPDPWITRLHGKGWTHTPLPKGPADLRGRASPGELAHAPRPVMMSPSPPVCRPDTGARSAATSAPPTRARRPCATMGHLRMRTRAGRGLVGPTGDRP